MLLFDGQVHYDTNVIPMGNYVIAFGHPAVFTSSNMGTYRQCERATCQCCSIQIRREERRGLAAVTE